MSLLLIILFLIRISIATIPVFNTWLENLWQRIRKSFKKLKDPALFDQYFIEPKAFYIKTFGTLPCISFIANIDAGKVFELVNNNKYGKVRDVYQRTPL